MQNPEPLVPSTDEPNAASKQAMAVLLSLGRCPHCRVRMNPWRVLQISRSAPYECPACAGKAAIEARSAMITVGAYVAALVIAVFGLDYAGAGVVEVYAVCLAAALTIPVAFAWLCRFEAADRFEPRR